MYTSGAGNPGSFPHITLKSKRHMNLHHSHLPLETDILPHLEVEQTKQGL